MRKEYIPSILLFALSALLYIAAAILLLHRSHHWATALLLGALVMLFASSRLVKTGNKLRSERDSKNEEKHSKGGKEL